MLLFTHPVAAALFGWIVRDDAAARSGHFFFEPKGYDEVNQATHEYKEEVKVGYNLRRKVVLHSIWALAPLRALRRPDAVRPVRRRTPTSASFLHHLSHAVARCSASARCCSAPCTCSSCSDVQTGLVWFTKILTDPFHDIMLYHRAPLPCCAAS